MVRILLLAATIGAGVFLIDRLFLWFERRGWMYWRRTKGRHGGAIGGAIVELHAALDPAAGKAAEVRKQDVVREDPSGEPPDPGASG